LSDAFQNGLPVEFAKVAERWSAVVVDQNVGFRTRLQQCSLAQWCGNIGRDFENLDATDVIGGNSFIAASFEYRFPISKDIGLMAVLFLLPLIFATLFSVAQQGGVDEATGATPFTVDVFLVNEDEGPFGAQVADAVLQMSMLKVEVLESAEDADRRVGEGERTAAILIPPGFSAGIDAYQQTHIDVVTDPVQQAIAVLPFVSTSADYEQVFFCDNLAAGSLNLLARVHQ